MMKECSTSIINSTSFEKKKTQKKKSENNSAYYSRKTRAQKTRDLSNEDSKWRTQQNVKIQKDNIETTNL